MAHQDPRSLQDLQKMRVDELISWLAKHRPEGLPTRAKQRNLENGQYEGVTPALLKSEEAAAGSKEYIRKPLKRPPLLWKTHRHRGKGDGPFMLSSELSERNAARFKSFDEEFGKHKHSLENHYSAYSSICEEIENDVKGLDELKDMLQLVGGCGSSDSEPEFISRRFVEYPPNNPDTTSEDEESPGCRFFFFRS